VYNARQFYLSEFNSCALSIWIFIIILGLSFSPSWETMSIKNIKLKLQD
jgi:hypothetical protein